jgi:hypothetical protein
VFSKLRKTVDATTRSPSTATAISPPPAKTRCICAM